jgi:hypothetical protein
MNSILLSLVLTTPQGLSVTQEHVLPVFGCGTGCRVETEQLSLPQRTPDGWLRVKVRQRTLVQKCDWKTTPIQCVDEPASGRAGPPVQDLWLFADCPGKRFATSKNPDRSDAWEQSVFHEEGDWKGTPKFQTYTGNPFMRWAQLFPVEAVEGKQQIRVIFVDSVKHLTISSNKSTNEEDLASSTTHTRRRELFRLPEFFRTLVNLPRSVT